jgi:hypothetical protein
MNVHPYLACTQQDMGIAFGRRKGTEGDRNTVKTDADILRKKTLFD